MKKPKYYSLTYIWTWPADIIAWLLVLIIWALWGTNLHWLEGLWCELKPKSWIKKHYAWGGTTFGHGGILSFGYAGGKGIDTIVERHEHIHVEFYEAAMLLAFAIALVVFIALAIIGCPIVGLVIGGLIWITGGLASYGSRSLQAIVRGEDKYQGNVEEEAAYAIAAQGDSNGPSK